MTKKVVKLIYENDFDFLLAGLISAHKDYKLCYELNMVLKVDFHRKEDIVVPAGKPGSNTRHSHFCSRGKDGEWYHVISNRDKDGTGFFIPEMRNIDFFLLLDQASGNFEMGNLIKSLRGIEIISGAFDIAPSEMKSADAFLLMLEG